MSSSGPSTPQVQQNNRMAILEDLQEKKKKMSAKMQIGGPPSATLPLKDNPMGMLRDPHEAQMSAAKQQAALQHAHNNSSAFFITQDSSFGNLILPVIPRLPGPPE